jgi:hypothetical protein
MVGGFNHLEKYEFVNGKDDIPYMKWKMKNVWNPNQMISIHLSICLIYITKSDQIRSDLFILESNPAPRFFQWPRWFQTTWNLRNCRRKHCLNQHLCCWKYGKSSDFLVKISWFETLQSSPRPKEQRSHNAKTTPGHSNKRARYFSKGSE